MPGVKITPIIPKRNPFGDPREISDVIVATLDDHAQIAEGLYMKATSTWSDANKPKVKIIKTKYGRVVTASGKVFGIVDQGARPHVIRAKRARVLAFSSKFRAKSRPRYLVAYSGGSGNVDTFRRQVYHPGSKPREFSVRVGEELSRTFGNLMTRNMQRYFVNRK